MRVGEGVCYRGVIKYVRNIDGLLKSVPMCASFGTINQLSISQRYPILYVDMEVTASNRFSLTRTEIEAD